MYDAHAESHIEPFGRNAIERFQLTKIANAENEIGGNVENPHSIECRVSTVMRIRESRI